MTNIGTADINFMSASLSGESLMGSLAFFGTSGPETSTIRSESWSTRGLPTLLHPGTYADDQRPFVWQLGDLLGQLRARSRGGVGSWTLLIAGVGLVGGALRRHRLVEVRVA
jgi:hypothetical protein